MLSQRGILNRRVASWRRFHAANMHQRAFRDLKASVAYLYMICSRRAIAGKRHCRKETLPERDIAGKRHCRKETLPERDIAGKRHCRKETLPERDIAGKRHCRQCPFPAMSL